MNIKKYLSIFVIAAFLFGISTYVYAAQDQIGKPASKPDNLPQGQMQGQGQAKKSGQPNGPMGSNRPMIMGTVTAIDDDTITIESKVFDHKDIKTGEEKTKTDTKEDEDNAKTVTYTVDASDATILEKDEEKEISDIEAGDKILVEGALSDTTITATKIHIGDFSGGKDGAGIGNDNTEQGNGNNPGFFKKIGNFFSRLFGFD